ncbi:MFS transporter [Roseibium sp.]|uniref:MFS transporter n=1 Tax=Roseibium sp. TaxID=1936156 RepID=UPI003A97E095
MFKSLSNPNYRLWAMGSLVSNVGTWMQRTAQDWLVLTQLTDHNASAVGFVMALQFGPQLLCLPWTGVVADSVDKRKLMLFTQSFMGLLALILAALTLSGAVELWHVYVLAFLQGCTASFDIPARQTYVAELVSKEDLPNAISLNSASFNGARMIGPATAGIVIALAGTGWGFLINALSFAAVLASLLLLKPPKDAALAPAKQKMKGSFTKGLAYVRTRDDLMTYLVMLFFIGTFGLNFPIFIATMATREFNLGASDYGFLSSCLAVGTVAGALLAANRREARAEVLVGGSFAFALASLAAAVMPSSWLFGLMLVFIGVGAITIMTTSMALMQMDTEPAMRGRVMAIRIAVTMGGTPLGAPIAGFVVDHFGPRWSMGLAVGAGLAAGVVGLRHLMRRRSAAVAAPASPSASASGGIVDPHGLTQVDMPGQK